MGTTTGWARKVSAAVLATGWIAMGGCGGGSSAPGLLSIAVTPDTTSIPAGLTQQFKATGTYSNNSTADLTSSAIWNSKSPSIATISASGLATAAAMGSTSVTATLGSVTGSATLDVTSATLESIAIAPKPATTGIAITVQLTAIGSYSDGTAHDVTASADWSSDMPSIATVGSNTGTVTGKALGSTTISATVGSIASMLPLTVIANAWVPTASLSMARTYQTATLLPNGDVLAAGGNGGPTGVYNTGAYSSAELFNPALGTWTSTGSLTTARVGHTATLLTNGTVLVAGGNGVPSMSGTSVFLSSAEIYNPALGTWTPTGNLTTPRVGHTATLLPDGTVLVAGGINSSGVVASAEVYDPVAGTWKTSGSLTTARENHTATLLGNGTVLVAGGDNNIYAGGFALGVLANAEIYDPDTGTWTPTGSLSTMRTRQTATLLPDGTVLVAGGYGVQILPDAANVLASTEIYNPTAGTWTLTGNLTTGRVNHTATLLPNGTVLAAGGIYVTLTYTGSAEIYDPVAGTWTPTGSLTTARGGHTATLLPGGAVMVAGGLGNNTGQPGSSSLLASSEIYY